MSHVTYEWVMSHMNESCLIWMDHVTYEWVMSHMNESRHIWMSHVTYEWIMSHMKDSCHIWMSHVSYEWVISHMYETVSHIWLGHVTYEWVMSHMHESCHTWMSHVTYEWVMSQMMRCSTSCHTWGSHVTNDLHHVTHECGTCMRQLVHEACHIWLSNFTCTWVTCRFTHEQSILTTVHRRMSHITPRTEEIGHTTISIAKFSNKFSQESPYRVPKISNGVSREYTESLSLKRVADNTGESEDPHIWSLFSTVSGNPRAVNRDGSPKMNEWFHIWIYHFKYEWDGPHRHESRRLVCDAYVVRDSCSVTNYGTGHIEMIHVDMSDSYLVA